MRVRLNGQNGRPPPIGRCVSRTVRKLSSTLGRCERGLSGDLGFCAGISISPSCPHSSGRFCTRSGPLLPQHCDNTGRGLLYI